MKHETFELIIKDKIYTGPLVGRLAKAIYYSRIKHPNRRHFCRGINVQRKIH